MAKNRNLKWSNYIDQAMEIYLNRKHRTIKMSPKLAELDINEDLVRKHLIEFFYKNGKNKTKKQVYCR